MDRKDVPKFEREILSKSWHTFQGQTEQLTAYTLSISDVQIPYAKFFVPNLQKDHLSFKTQRLWIRWTTKPSSSFQAKNWFYGMINATNFSLFGVAVQVGKLVVTSTMFKVWIRSDETSLEAATTRIRHDPRVASVTVRNPTELHPGGDGCSGDGRCDECGKFCSSS